MEQRTCSDKFLPVIKNEIFNKIIVCDVLKTSTIVLKLYILVKCVNTGLSSS